MSGRAHTLVVVVAAAVLLAPGCGGTGAGDERGPGRLVVMETLPPRPVYIEGSVSFLRVERSDSGEVIADGAMTDGEQPRGDAPLLSRELEPGEYRILSFQRPCHGNCDYLDAPTDRCAAVADVVAGRVLTATVVLHQRGGCTIESSTGTVTP